MWQIVLFPSVTVFILGPFILAYSFSDSSFIIKYQLFLDATVELSLDSTQNNQKKVPAKTLISLPPQEATNSSKPQPSYEEVRICAIGLLLDV